MNWLYNLQRIGRRLEAIGLEQDDISPMHIRTRMINTVAICSFCITLLFASLNLKHNPLYLIIADILYLVAMVFVLRLNARRSFEGARTLLVSAAISILIVVHLTYGDAEYHLICVAVAGLLILERFIHQLICNIIVTAAIVLPKILLLVPDHAAQASSIREVTNLMINLFFIIILIRYFISIQQRYQLRIMRQKNYLSLQNKQREQVYAIIAHDMRSPLTTSYQCIDMIVSGDVSEKESKSLLQKVSAQLMQINKTAEILVNWRNRSGEDFAANPRNIALKTVIPDVISSVGLTSRKKEIDFRLDIEDDLYAYIDPTHLEIILSNLLINALKFSPRRGEIYLRAVSATPYTQIVVQDKGTGMARNVLNGLFSDLVVPAKGTEGEVGMGFGLQMSQKLAIANDGIIQVESIFGQGSTFTLLIPAKA